MAALSASGWLGASAFAQEAQRIEITGSAIKRIEAEGSLPVQVISREEIVRSGFTSTEALLNSIAAVSSIGATNNATGAGSSTNGISTISMRGLGGSRTLVLVNGRRLAPAASGGGAVVNVNNIPLSAIERVEVLKDGASSVYGSEALAGVVNFILSKNFTGIELGIGYGEPTRDGGGATQRATLTAGFGNLNTDRFNVTASVALEKEKAIFGRDRAFAAKSDVFPFTVGAATGQGAIQGGWNTAGTVDPNAVDPWASFKLQGFAGGGLGGSYGAPVAATGGSGCDSIRMFDAGNVGKINDPRAARLPDGSLNPARIGNNATSRGIGRYCQYDSGGDVGLIPDRELQSFTLNGAVRLSDTVELFGDVLFSRNTVIQTFQPSPLRNSFLQTVPDPWIRLGYSPVLLINPSNPNYATAANYLTALANSIDPAVPSRASSSDPTQARPGDISRRQEILNLIGNPLAITARVFDFGPRSTSDETIQNRFVYGLRGSIGETSYEVAGFTTKNSLNSRTRSGYFSQTQYANAVSSNNTWNPWSLNQTPAFQAAIAPSNYVGPIINAKSESSGFDGKLTGDLFKLPAGAAQYSVGGAVRSDDYELKPSQAYLDGDISGLGGNVVPITRDRRIYSVFGEGLFPLMKTLEASVAYRHDRYNDVGAASTHKASLRWQPLRWLGMRVGGGTGFRAPTLEDLWYPQTTGTSEQVTDPRFPDEAGVQVQLTTGGNPALKAERSNQQSLGIILQPTNSTSLALDYWRLDISGILATPSTQEVISRFRAGDAAFASLVDLDGTGRVQRVRATLANVGKAKVQGVDLEGSTRFNAPGGRVDVRMSGTYMIRFDQTSPGGALSRKVGTMVEDTFEDGERSGSLPVLEADSGGVVLRWKHNFTVGYTFSGFTVQVAQNYYSGYRTADRQYDGEKNFVKAQSLYDLAIGYSGFKGLNLNVGIKNVADKDPPVYVPASNQFQSGYDIGLYDPRARTWFVSANYKF